MSRNSLAHMELSRALSASGAARIEGLVKLSQREPQFAPVWGALAEEHWRSRRREEALQAARRALRLDPALHKRFSRELSMATRHILAEAEGGSPASAPPATKTPARTPAASSGRAQAARPQAARPAGPPSQAARELEQAASLVGYRRRNRLEELSQEYPDHAPIWLALAEENLAQRSVNHALDALDRALHLDPTLDNLMSPELERARKYTRREPLYADDAGPESRPAAAPSTPSAMSAMSAPSTMTPSAVAPGDSAGLSGSGAGAGPMAAAGEPAPVMAMGAMDVAAPRPEPPRPSPLVSKMLATALALRDRGERIAVLQELAIAAPEDTDVLFHLAQEQALDGRTEEARDVGNRLRELSPERYNDLYAWAESNLTAQAQAESDLTRVLRVLDAEPPAAPPAPVNPVGQWKVPVDPDGAWDLIEDEDDVTTMKVKDRDKARPAPADVALPDVALPDVALPDVDMDDEVTTRADMDSFRARPPASAAMGPRLKLGGDAGPGPRFEPEEEVTMKVSGEEIVSPAFKTDRMELPPEAPERMGYERADSEFTTRPLWVSGQNSVDPGTAAEPEPRTERAPTPAPVPAARPSTSPPAPQAGAQPGRRQLTPSKHVIRRTSLSKKNLQGAAPEERRSTPAKPDAE